MEVREKCRKIFTKSQSNKNLQEEKNEKSKLNLSFSKKYRIYRSPRYLSRIHDSKPEIDASRTIDINSRKKIPAPILKPIEIPKKEIKKIQNTSSNQKSTYSNSQKKNYLSNSNLNGKTNLKDNKTNPKITHTCSSTYIRRNQISQNTTINTSKAPQIKITSQKTQTINNRKNIPKPTINNYSLKTNINSNIKVSNCKNTSNVQQKYIINSKTNNIPQINNRRKIENKENLDENIKKIIKQHTYDINSPGNKQQVIYNDYQRKDVYINSRGGVVFKTQDSPTTNIIIVNHKPNYSIYHNQSKTLGKHHNIGIYEDSAVEKKVIIRPIKK